MRFSQYAAPTIEPISLAELKLHLRLDSGSLSDNLEEVQSLAPGSKVIANNYTTHVGTGVDVLGYQAIVCLNSGANGAGGTVDVKVQDSDDNVTFTDWGTAFTQVTEANDNAIQEKAYTGAKQYVRTVAKVLVAACEFGTTVIRQSPTSAEDDSLTAIIQAAREQVENITGRALLTQTWDYSIDKWPSGDAFKLPFGNLQSVTSLKHKDTDGTETTMTVTTEYLVEDNGDKCARIVLPYGVTWPTETLYPSNPITVRFVCGWTTAASIPAAIRTAVKMVCADLYENRESQIVGNIVQAYSRNKTADTMLASYRIWDEFP